MFGGSGLSLADIAAVTKNNDNNNGNDGMFGGNNGWWILIILFAIFGGWGNNGGYGNGGRGETTIVTVPPMGCYGGGSGMYGFENAALQRGFDNQTVINKLDGLNNGICSLGYDQLAQMNGLNNTVQQTGWNLQQGMNQLGIAGMQNTNALSTQISQCCCDNKAMLADLKYTMATESCATNTNIHQTGDVIINSQNQGFQMLNNTIKDGFCQLEMREMARENRDLRDRLNACDRDSALLAQSNYLVRTLRPQAEPAYIVQNPNGCSSAVPVQVMNSSSGCSSCSSGTTYATFS